MQTNSTVDLSDLELPLTPSQAMPSNEVACYESDKYLVVGYLVDDYDCENPLESCDGLGKVLSAERFAGNESEIQEALALDSNGNPDYYYLQDYVGDIRPLWIDAAAKSKEFQEWVDEQGTVLPKLVEDYYAFQAASFWAQLMEEQESGLEELCDRFDFSENVINAKWKDLRERGVIGDQDAVILDRFEHSGVIWSLSGTGPQCQFDTAQSAGIWVPDDCAREEIDRRAQVYAFGTVKANGPWTVGSGRLRYYAEMDSNFGGHKSEEFKQWHEAFSWLTSEIERRNLILSSDIAERRVQEAEGRDRAKKEIAEGAVEQYNQWLAGATYGHCAAAFERVDGKEDPEEMWSFLESDECFGYIGDEYAEQEADMAACCLFESLTKKAAA